MSMRMLEGESVIYPICRVRLLHLSGPFPVKEDKGS